MSKTTTILLILIVLIPITIVVCWNTIDIYRQDQEIDRLKWNQNVIEQYLRCKEGLIIDCNSLTK